MGRETSQRGVRDRRINIRSSARQERLLRQAAAATDKTVTDFVLDSAVLEAERVLVDQRFFSVDEQQWRAFHELLDAPRRDLPKLKVLLEAPSPFDDENA
ncbi:MAG: antitoxin [Acidimicrobiales bacterium]|nr:MAG: antitoxin [Acidimicrobiales bacterium]